jgi:hypothetical protein
MSMERLILHPAEEFVPVPWWSWTGDLDPRLLRRQLDVMRDQGIREFFIFPLYGLDVEYMSETYLDRIEQVCEWCQELGMRVWIYDEHNWPSGMAGGLVARKHPEAIGWSVWFEDGEFRPKRDATPNITSCGSVWCKREPGMLDLMSREAVRAFITEAYDPIYARCKRFFGNVIKGFFTDEPTMPPGPIPWTPELPEKFNAKYGYDLVPVLHDLTTTTPTSDRTRADYWALVSELSADAFTGQLAEWCAERGVVLTGHLSMEEGCASVWPHADSPTHLKRMQVPGCDMLGLYTSWDTHAPWGRQIARTVAPKVASSSARAAGRDRVMCEAYGIAPWTRTMAEEKRLTDWLVALGVNLINDNGLITDISRFRKRGLAGKHWTQPWWSDAKLQYDYAASLSAFCAGTKLDAHVAVLYPSTTWWTLVQRECRPPQELSELERAFHRTIDALVRTHWDWEFLFEDDLAAARIENGELVTSFGRFSVVVAAGISRVPADAAARLRQFAANVLVAGGTLDLAGAVDVPMPDCDADLRFELDALLVRHFEYARQAAAIRHFERSEKSPCGPAWRVTGDEADGVISAARADAEGRRALLVANMTPGDKQLDICWQGDWPVAFVDAASRKQWVPEQGEGNLGFILPEGESVVVVRGNDAKPTAPPAHFRQLPGFGYWQELPGPWEFATYRPNIFRLQCRVLPDPDGRFTADALPADGWLDTDWGDCGAALTPESCKCYWMAAEFDLEAAVPDLQVVVDSDDTLEAWLNGMYQELSGAEFPIQRLAPPKPVEVWEFTNLAWDLSAAKPGRNSLLLKVKPSVYHSDSVIGCTPGTGIVSHAPIKPSMTEPVVLRGSFGVREDDVPVITEMPRELEQGDWNSQGLPHFAGVGMYKMEFNWARTGPALFACEAGQDLVEVLIDGASLGKRAWGRRWFEIPRLGKGKHVAEVRIANTFGCVLRRTYDAYKYPAAISGLLAPPRVVAL